MRSKLTLLRSSMILTCVALAATTAFAGHPAGTAVDNLFRAYRAGDIEASKAAVLPHQRGSLAIDEGTQKLLDSAVVRDVAEQTAAEVWIRQDLNGKSVTAPVQVVKEGFDWFVDLETTMGSLMAAAMGEASEVTVTTVESNARGAVTVVEKFFAADSTEEAMRFVLPAQRDSGFSVTPQASPPQILGGRQAVAASVTVTFPPLSRSVHDPISMKVPCRKDEADWRVDLDGLKGAMVQIAMTSAMSEVGEQLGEAMAQGMQQVAEEMASGMAEAMTTIASDMTAAMEAAAEPSAPAHTGSGGWAGEMDGAVRPGSYTVQPGDSLWEISRWAYGDPMWYDKIAEANGMNPHYDDLTVGQVLVIPVRNF